MASFQCYSNCCHLLAVYMCALLHTSARTIQRYNIKRYLNLHSLALWSVDCKLALSLLEISINLYLFACWWKPNWLASLFGSSGLSFSYLIQSHISVWPGGKSQSWKVFLCLFILHILSIISYPIIRCASSHSALISIALACSGRCQFLYWRPIAAADALVVVCLFLSDFIFLTQSSLLSSGITIKTILTCSIAIYSTQSAGDHLAHDNLSLLCAIASCQDMLFSTLCQIGRSCATRPWTLQTQTGILQGLACLGCYVQCPPTPSLYSSTQYYTHFVPGNQA